MDSDRPGRVVVGIAPSLSGLQALRAGVAEARARAAQLHAVRVADPSTPDRRTSTVAALDMPLAGTESASVIYHAFADTMGGPPDGVDVRAVVMPDAPGPVLCGYASRDGDLLVLGTGRRSRWRRPWGSGLIRYCLSHANCPVLVVPPPPLARDGSTRALVRRLRREIDHVTGDPAGYW